MSNIVKTTGNQTSHSPIAKRTVAQLSDGSCVVMIYDQNLPNGGATSPVNPGAGSGSSGSGSITSRAWTIKSGPMGTGTTIATQAALAWVPGSSTSPSTTTDIRQPIIMEMCFEIVSTIENSTLDWTSAYSYIQDINDDRGYTGGLIGFTSSTGDMLELVQYYVQLKPTSNPLQQYISGLQQCTNVGFGDQASSAAATYLGQPFKTAWANAAANDPLFRQAQRDLRKSIYWDDALTQALADGVGPLGMALHYDILVNHGPGTDSESYGGILAAARASSSKPPSAGGNEAAYLTKLCDLRDAVLQGWGDYQSDGRSSAYRALINAGKLSLIAPYSWSVYGDSYTVNTRPAPVTDSVIGTYILTYTAQPVGSDDVQVTVIASGTANQGSAGTAGTLSAGTDATILANTTFTRTATEPTSGGGGTSPTLSQTVDSPSDGTSVGKFYLYHSVDRLTWVKKATVTPTTAPATSGAYCIYSMSADSNNNVHLTFAGTDSSVRYYKFTTSGSAGARTFTAGSQETAMAAPGVSGYVLRMDVDVLTGTQAVLCAIQWRNGQSMGYRFLLRRLQDNTWVTSWTETVWTNQTPAWADISVAWDSNNSSSTDENGRTWFAVYVSKISTAQDFGDNITQWALNPTNGQSIVTSSQQTSNNLNINLGGKIRRGCLFSTAPGQYTLLGAVGTSNFFTFALTFTNGGSQPVPYVKSSQTGITINRLVGGANDVGFAWQDYRGVVVYGGTDGRAYAHVYTFYTDGTLTPQVSTTNYAWDNFYRASSSRYASWFCGGSNRYAWSGFKNLDMIVWDSPSGDTASAGGRGWRHQYNIPPVAPKTVTPSNGSQVISNIPSLTVDLDLDMDYPQSKTKVVWQIAWDNSFTQNLRTITEPDANFRYLTMSGSTSAVTKVSYQVDSANALFTGTWYIRAAFISELGLQGPWSTTQSFFVGHPASPSNMHPSGNEFWTYSPSGTPFTWTFTDTAAGDYQTAYQLVVERADNGTVLYDTSKVSSAAGTGLVQIDASFKDVQLRWKLRLWDMDDTQGAFSDYQTFYLGDGPAINVTSPAQGVTIATPTPIVEWDVEVDGFRVLSSFRVLAKRANGQIDYDSGWRAISGTSPYAFMIDNNTAMQNNVNYTIEVHVRDTKGLESYDSNSVTTSWIPPNPPPFTVNGTLFQENGYVNITWSNSAVDPTWTSYRVYRRVYSYDAGAYGPWVLIKEVVTPATTFTYQDWSAPANSNIQYSVVQVATRFDAPVESVYNTLSVTTENSDYWLINPLDSSLNLRVAMTSESFKEEYEQEVYHVLGRGRHVDQGDRLGYSGSFSVQFRDQPGNSARAQRLAFDAVIKRQTPVYLRSPFGDVVYVVLMNASYDRVPGMGQHEAVNANCDYVEVAV